VEYHRKLFKLESYDICDEVDMFVDWNLIKFWLWLFAKHKWLIRYPHFVFVAVAKTLFYNYFLYLFRPKYVYSFAEASVTGPLVTLYMNRCGVRHCSIMHGVRIQSVKEAFTYFNTMYVWGDYWMWLFKDLYCKTEAFVCTGHPIVAKFKDVKALKNNNDQAVYNVVFILQMPESQDWGRIKDLIAEIEATTQVRFFLKPHPLYTSVARDYFSGYRLCEMPKEVVLRNFHTFMGYTSTFLVEAFILKKKVILVETGQTWEIPLLGPRVLRVCLPLDKKSRKEFVRFIETPPNKADLHNDHLYINRLSSAKVEVHLQSRSNQL